MSITLPSYFEKSDVVEQRFQKLYDAPKILEVKDMNKVFTTNRGEITALETSSFSVHRREFLSIIGSSGCGKSTLIRILAGLENQTDGTVLLDGNEFSGPSSSRGMVFQGYTLFPWLTAKKNVMFGLEVKGMSAQTAEAEAKQWLEFVGLEKFANSYPDQLSGGMKQRVAIARALANKPRVLLMDEPFGALDAQTRAQMQRHLLEIWKNVDVTIVFITHDLDEAIYLSDRILVLKPNPGRIAELIENPVPRPRTTEQFLSPPFLSVKKRLEELIHPKTEQVSLPIVKLTAADDDVE